ncbi:hypothetical protein H5410_003667 [Solanum commersonii]|uniref:Uncharacterized protein n=1 Tax=Solanum commersonii TaxID=4109 RepID=A0A9J6B5D3_SOLCO|nr:hypothetical protein H5410_003667 [Solanum commersonii]
MDPEIKRARRKKIASDESRIKWGGLTPAFLETVASKVLGVSGVTLEAIKEIRWWNGKSKAKWKRRRRLIEWVECVDEEVALRKVYKTTKTKLS